MNLESTWANARIDVIVVGAGPAGMTAALFGAQGGAKVLLLDRNEKCGKKLYITGKGRCNLTNTAQGQDFFDKVPRNPRFLMSAISRFTSEDTVRWMESLGVPCQVQRGGRVFPASEKASDVTRALEHALREAGVQVALGARVKALHTEGEAFSAVELEDGSVIPAKACILATGGAGYPMTGSSGDGYALARAARHTVYPPRPALVPIETSEEWPKDLAGLSLKNVRLTAMRGKKKLYDRQGEMLFTHFGISGPLVIELSSYIVDIPPEEIALSLDMKPALDEAKLDARLVREFSENPRKQLAGVLPSLLPSSLARIAPGLIGLDPATPAAQIPKADRARIAAWLKGIPLTIRKTRGMNEAVVTRGGIEVREIAPGTMESKKMPGLYFAGEIIDVDALTGGFNLQIAFATGALAGQSAAEFCKG